MIKFTIPGDPKTKKNSQKIITIAGHAKIAPSAAYKAWEKQAVYFIPNTAKNAILTPCNVKAVYYMATRRRVDLSNLNSALHDALVTAGVLADDNRDIVAATDGSRVYWDKTNPRTEVTITPIEEEYLPWHEEKATGPNNR